MPTLSQSLEVFLQVDRSPFTTRNYRRILLSLITAIGPARDMRHVTYEECAEYFYPLIKPLKRSTALAYLNVMQNFFGFCHRRGYIAFSPVEDLRVRRGTAEPVMLKAVPPDELARMADYARVTSKRNFAILLFLAATGCRVQAVASLTIPNLRLVEQRALVREKGGDWVWKVFGEFTQAALEDWLTHRPQVDHDFVFTTDKRFAYTPMKERNISDMIAVLAAKTGATVNWRAHAVRHGKGNSLARLGYEESVAQRALGHSSPVTTINFYYPKDDDYIAAILRQNELSALGRMAEPKEPEKIIPLLRGHSQNRKLGS